MNPPVEPNAPDRPQKPAPPTPANPGAGRPGAIWTLAVLLALLHQDFWLWDDKSLLLGFLPSGLAYHIGFSIAAATLWAAALRFAWPIAWEAWANEKPGA